MTRVSVPTVIIGVLMIAVLVTYAFTHQVSFHEAAVKVQLGQAQAVIKEPGLKFRWPWPIEMVRNYDVRLRTLDSPETEIKTLDGKNVIIGTYVVWRISDPLLFYKRIKVEANAEDQMRARIAQAQAAVIGQKTLPYFVNLDRQAVDRNYAELFEQLRAELAPALASDYGIAIEDVGVRRISLPKEVTQEVFNSMIAERKSKAAQFREEGKSRAEAIKARAAADADSILAFANTKAGAIRSEGIQASTRILAQINESDRELFEWLLWLDALKGSLKDKSTIFIGQDWPLFDKFVRAPVMPVPAAAEAAPQTARPGALEVQPAGDPLAQTPAPQ